MFTYRTRLYTALAISLILIIVNAIYISSSFTIDEVQLTEISLSEFQLQEQGDHN